MNEKEIGEIRRRVRRDRSNMTAIYGCYVNDKKEIISQFSQSLAIMPENESEKYFALLRRSLSGTLGKNLVDICFRTAQVADSPEHKLLMTLRSSGCKDEEARQEIFGKIIENVSFEGNFVILLGCDTYDVPFKSRDDFSQADNSDQSFTYVLCAVCPVKQTKPMLHYVHEEQAFHDGGALQSVSAPEVGFLFPAFDNRATNIYNALLYTRDIKQGWEELIDTLFKVEPPKPAAQQKQDFEALIGNTLQEECSLEVVQSVHDHFRQAQEMHKESKVPEPLMISKEEVKSVLASCGVSEDKLAKFSVDYDADFGFEAELHPKNVVDSKRFEIKTADVVIKVSPEKSDLIETRIIGGVPYILICADESVEVNGVPIHIANE